MSLLFNMLSRLIITFLLRSKRLLISWLQSPSAVILEPKKIKSDTVSTVSPSISHEVITSQINLYLCYRGYSIQVPSSWMANDRGPCSCQLARWHLLWPILSDGYRDTNIFTFCTHFHTSNHRPLIQTCLSPNFQATPFQAPDHSSWIFSFIWLHWVLAAVCGISFPDQGWNRGPLQWERSVLATGPPGKSPSWSLIWSVWIIFILLCTSHHWPENSACMMGKGASPLAKAFLPKGLSTVWERVSFPAVVASCSNTWSE